MNLNDDIKIAQLIVSGNLQLKSKTFHNYSFIYKTTNENIRGFLDKIKIQPNSKILTVSSSMDQAFSFTLFNPSRIDCFDITIFSKYFFELKISAVKNLEYEEYIEYFFKSECYENEFSEEIYDKIKKDLSLESRIFWDSLYNFFDGYEIYNSFLFSTEFYSLKNAKRLNLYLEEENFKKLKNSLKQIGFKQIDIMSEELYGNYDYIYLSNIIDYYDKKVYKNKIEELKHLKESTLVLTYLYNFNAKKEQLIRETFNSNCYSFHKLENGDAVMEYKKI